MKQFQVFSPIPSNSPLTFLLQWYGFASDPYSQSALLLGSLLLFPYVWGMPLHLMSTLLLHSCLVSNLQNINSVFSYPDPLLYKSVRRNDLSTYFSVLSHHQYLGSVYATSNPCDSIIWFYKMSFGETE